MKIVKYADEETEREIREKIKEAEGHCPCVLKVYRCKDTLCMCKSFREAPAGTICTCGLYQKLAD